MTQNTKQNFVDMKPLNLFATPNSLDELHRYLEQFNGSEAMIAQTSAMMMYNYIVTNYNLSEK